MTTRYALISVFTILFGLLSVVQGFSQIDSELIVGIWPLNEGEGDTAVDVSGNGRDGTITGAEWDDGEQGKALDFEKNDTVEILLGDGIIANELTVVLWLKFTDLSGQQNYFSIWDSSNNRYVPYKTDGQELRFWTNNWNHGSGFQVDKNTWYHVANVYDGETGSIYVNGEKKVSLPGQFSLQGDQQSAWFATDQGGWVSACTEDEIGIFATALTEDEIVSIMNHGIMWALEGAAVNSASSLSTTWGSLKL
jgi:hypothetical protein